MSMLNDDQKRLELIRARWAHARYRYEMNPNNAAEDIDWLIDQAARLLTSDTLSSTPSSTWTEVRIKGQSDGEYPAYDFTFRSNNKTWSNLYVLLNRAFNHWTDAIVTMRQVTQQATEWRMIRNMQEFNGTTDFIEENS